ncbi:MAG: AbrB/MazE/SpoVT family DNA-binding domain-containing protein [Gaiellaceae bacterium]
MKLYKITDAGQLSLPASVRRRWATSVVQVDDRGDHVVVRPVAEDPIRAARGALKNPAASTDELRKRAREDERGAESRR